MLFFGKEQFIDSLWNILSIAFSDKHFLAKVFLILQQWRRSIQECQKCWMKIGQFYLCESKPVLDQLFQSYFHNNHASTLPHFQKMIRDIHKYITKFLVTSHHRVVLNILYKNLEPCSENRRSRNHFLRRLNNLSTEIDTWCHTF